MYRISSGDNTFATVLIILAKRAAIVTPELEAHCEAVISRTPPSGKANITKRALLEDAYAYTGLGMAGPGGSEERLVAAWPSRGMDLQVKLVLPGDPPLESDAATEAYHRLIMGEIEPLAVKLLEMAQQVARAIEQGELQIAVAGGKSQDGCDPGIM